MRWLLTLLLLWPAITGAVHVPWMQGYRDAEGTSCCARTDCRPAEVMVLNQARGEVMLDGEPLTIPPGSLHRIPPEAHEPEAPGYFCYKGEPHEVTAANARCVFFKTPLW